ncbi:MAG: EAL domain-containing protein [Spirochaetia bacterium]|nr:EAL domain-containing protein [Spirochaetia bacterium]
MSLRVPESKFEFIANTSKEFMTLINKGFLYEAANKSYLQAHGLKLENVLGKSVKEIWGTELFEQIIKPAMMETFNGHEIEYESWFSFPALGKRCFEVRQYPYRDIKGEITHVVVVSRDITDRKEAQLKLAHLAYHDDQTGLCNRKKLLLDLPAKLENKKLYGIFSIYLSNIKKINDTLGYEVGDNIIVESVQRMKALVKNEEDIARIGGSTFTFIHELKDKQHGEMIAKEILRLFSNPYKFTKYDFRNTSMINANIGVSYYPEHAGDPDLLLKRSNIALHQSIELGPNNFSVYSFEMDERLSRNLQIEKNLLEAIEKDQFILYYQPKINVKKEIVGMEALIRWQHPEDGLILPIDFIPVAEKTGLIAPIGYWVIEEAARFNKYLNDKLKIQLRVSVNLSPFQFVDSRLLKTLKDILKNTKLSANLLELEITESGTMDSIDKSIEILNEMKKLGVKISIDDFGTGFSSLSKISTFPIDTLKIDKSFVDEVPGNVDAMITVTSIINLARNLGFDVVTEGVETQEQFDYLVSVGCREIQGYYFSKPLSAEDFENKINLK